MVKIISFSALALIINIFSLINAFSQENPLRFGGFVRMDAVYDSRESVALRESSIMLFPKPQKLNISGDDIYSHSALTMYLLHTRLNLALSGAEAFGAKLSGFIEGEFFGASDEDANGFRLRHAYINLGWEDCNLLIGQYWNPMFITDVLPNFNFASPFLAYGRRPQLRYTQKAGDFELSAAASMQSDFKSIGPDTAGRPVRSLTFNKNASLPSFNLYCAYKKGDFLIGACGDYKALKPGISANGILSEELLHSYSGAAYLKLKIEPLTFKLQGIYCQNLADLVMLGGYALRLEDSSEYTNFNIISFWSELSSALCDFDGGGISLNLFAGYTKNLGTSEAALPNKSKMYALGSDVDNVLRLAPSIVINSHQLRFVGELEYTAAVYGSSFKNDKLALTELKNYGNIRLNLAAIYHF